MNEQNNIQYNEPARSSQNPWIIIASIVITALVIGGAVYVWQNSILKSTETSLQQQITLLQNQISQLQQTQTEESQQTADGVIQQNSNLNEEVLTDLQTYKNLGFKINYPKTWVIDKNYESEGVIFLRTESRQADLDAGKMVRVFDVEVRVYDNASRLPNNDQTKLSFEDWINEKADEYGFVERSPIIIDGVNGYKGVASGMTYGNYLQFVEYSGRIYQIEIEGDKTEEKMKIVSSFKFVK